MQKATKPIKPISALIWLNFTLMQEDFRLDVYKRQGTTRATSVSVQTGGGRFDCQPGLTTRQANLGAHPPAATRGRKLLPFYSSKPMKSAHRAGAKMCIRDSCKGNNLIVFDLNLRFYLLSISKERVSMKFGHFSDSAREYVITTPRCV